jgi:Tol biopolymer transport system component/serine/threonine protein kinase
VLADCASADPQQRRRFEQEARTVSTLSHPNICTLYDIGCETPSDGQPSAREPAEASGPVQFLVMEFLEGETLSKRLRRGSVPLDEALEIGAQIADALAAAHRHGVIHRDLKPGNIMVMAAGSGLHAKLLDFGLAKLRPTPPSGLESTHSFHEPQTRPGAVLGTLPYMAPEQLEGKATDARTDIFALGCVLYEMLTGRRAFGGDSEASVISAIMAREPDPVAALQPATPAALDHLIRRCLQKDAEQRSESAHDLADELRWLRETHGASGTGGHPLRRRVTDSRANDGPVPPVPLPRRQARPRRRVLVIGLLGFAVAGYGVPAYVKGWWPWQRDPFSSATPRQITTESGLQAEPAVSPDGSQIAYMSNEGGTAHIWVAETDGSGRSQLTEGAAPDHDPAWHKDGNEVYFTRYEGAEPGVWKVPRLARRPDEASRVLRNAAQPALSPGGDRLAFVREVDPAGETRVFVAPIGNLPLARQVTSDSDGLWSHSHPSWSPSGRWICYAVQHALWKTSADGGRAVRLTSDNESATDPVWSADEKWIYYTSTRGGTTALWRIGASGGAPARVTSGSGLERQPSMSRAGDVLAYSSDDANLGIVLHNLATGVSDTFHDSVRLELMPRFLPDHETVTFVSEQPDGRIELWTKSLGTGPGSSGARRLIDLPGKEVVHPSPSPTGDWIACYRVIDGKRDIWILNRDGTSVAQVTHDPAQDIQPAWSPDGKRLAFASDRGGSSQIWTVPVANGHAAGQEVQATRHAKRALAPEWSPDGQWIGFVDRPSTRDSDVWAIRADGSGSRRVSTGAGAYRIRWVEPDRMVVSGTWGEHALSLRVVNPDTGVATALAPPVVMGDEQAAHDFDIDLERGIAVFARSTAKGNIWTLTKRR